MTPEVYDRATDPGKDYVLQFKIKNGPLLRALRSRGYHSVRQFAVKHKLPYSIICRYLALTSAPIQTQNYGKYTRGDWRKSALDMAKALRIPPDELFPKQHIEQALERASGEIEISHEEIKMLIEHDEPLDPEQQLVREQASTGLLKLLSTLPPKEERVLRMHFGLGGPEQTYEEIGKEFGVSRERVRQMEASGLRKLKHPSRSQEARSFGDDLGVRFVRKEVDERNKRDRFYVPKRKEPKPTSDAVNPKPAPDVAVYRSGEFICYYCSKPLVKETKDYVALWAGSVESGLLVGRACKACADGRNLQDVSDEVRKHYGKFTAAI